MQTIIGLVGEKLAGKDTAANYLAKKYGAFVVKFSEILDEILGLLLLPKSRRNEIDLGLGLRNIFGDEVLYRALVEKVKKSAAGIPVINGLRMDEQERAVRDLGAKIIYITAPPEVRFARYQNRHEKPDDAVMNFEQFNKQEKELTEIGIPELGKRADFKIENIGSLEELYGKVERIIESLKIKMQNDK